MGKYQTICKRVAVGASELSILQLADTGADIPYFGQIWGSSRWLSQVVCSLDLKGKSVLEIGCGLAMPTLFAAKQGARCTAVDVHEDCEEFLLDNIARNELTGRVKFRLTDWETLDVSQSEFDLVMGSDLLYSKGQAESLTNFLHRTITDDNAALIVDPGREYIDQFVEMVKAKNLVVARTNQFVKQMKYIQLWISTKPL